MILWGNGSKNPSFGKGYASGPNQMFYQFFAEQGCRVIICDEANTSRDSVCCGAKVCHPPYGASHRRHGQPVRGISLCPECRTYWSRDTGSAIAIGNKFWSHGKVFPNG